LNQVKQGGESRNFDPNNQIRKYSKDQQPSKNTLPARRSNIGPQVAGDHYGSCDPKDCPRSSDRNAARTPHGKKRTANTRARVQPREAPVAVDALENAAQRVQTEAVQKQVG